MARPLRIQYEGAFYHVFSRGNERREIFYDQADYQKFKEYLKCAQEKYGYILHCYVLMTNHYHLLVETPRGNLSQVMHYINSSYPTYINAKRKRAGHLYQGRYDSVLIEQDRYLLEVSRYLHLNPFRANMVKHPRFYEHSSYLSYVEKKREDFVCPDFVLGMVSSKRKIAVRKYQEYVEQGMTEDIENPFQSVYGGMILGSEQFIKDTLSRFKVTLHQRDDISNRRELLTALSYNEIITVLCHEFGISQEELFSCKKERRNIAVFLLKKYTALTNKEIGSLFPGITYSAVSKINQRFKKTMSEDKSLRKRVQRIMAKMSHVKG